MITKVSISVCYGNGLIFPIDLSQTPPLDTLSPNALSLAFNLSRYQKYQIRKKAQNHTRTAPHDLYVDGCVRQSREQPFEGRSCYRGTVLRCCWNRETALRDEFHALLIIHINTVKG